MPRRKEPRIPDAILDQLLAGADPKTAFDPNGTREGLEEEVAGHLRDLYGIDVSPDLVSAVTDAVLEEVAAWQARPLEAAYPLVFFDALRVKVRDEGLVRNKAVHIALGVRADGTKEVLGLWLEQNEGAKFWLRVMNELR